MMKASTRGKISKAQAQRMNAAHSATVMQSPKEIPESHRSILEDYVCKAADKKDQAVVHAAFTAVMERTSYILSRAFFIKNCSDVANLAAWAHRMQRDISWQGLMSHEVISEYIRGATLEGNSAHLSQRLRRLKSLASHLNPGITAPPQVAPVGHKAVSDPYTYIEMAAITRIASTQQNESITRQLAFILGACRGAGAGVTDLRDLRRNDIDDRGVDGIYITLGVGERKRTIPVRLDWEDYMRRGISGLSATSLAIGTVRNRKNIAGEVLGRAVALGKDAPHIEAGRLRTTYIAELMSEAIPVQVILNATGLVGARTLTDLARRFTQEEINSCFGELRGAN